LSAASAVIRSGPPRIRLRRSTRLDDEGPEAHLYQVALDGLEPGSWYFYQVSSSNSESTIASFATFAEKQPGIHFVAMGNSRSNPDILADGISVLQADEPDFISSTGDQAANGGGDLPEWSKSPNADMIGLFKLGILTLDSFLCLTELKQQRNRVPPRALRECPRLRSPSICARR